MIVVRFQVTVLTMLQQGAGGLKHALAARSAANLANTKITLRPTRDWPAANVRLTLQGSDLLSQGSVGDTED